MTRLIVGLLLCACMAMPSFAATFSIRHIKDQDGSVVDMDGEIMPGDIQRMLAVMATDYEQSHLRVLVLGLNSKGGEVTTARELAATVANYKIATFVPTNGVCASACFLIFACGAQRYVDTGARIGVHSASNANNVETVFSYTADVDIARQAKTCGVPDAIVGKMITTPPHSIYWLTQIDLAIMGVQGGSIN